MAGFVQRQPALASLYVAAARGVDLSGDRAGQPTMRLIQQDNVGKTEPHAVVRTSSMMSSKGQSATLGPLCSNESSSWT